jgi:hypothetical protein
MRSCALSISNSTHAGNIRIATMAPPNLFLSKDSKTRRLSAYCRDSFRYSYLNLRSRHAECHCQSLKQEEPNESKPVDVQGIKGRCEIEVASGSPRACSEQ